VCRFGNGFGIESTRVQPRAACQLGAPFMLQPGMALAGGAGGGAGGLGGGAGGRQGGGRWQPLNQLHNLSLPWIAAQASREGSALHQQACPSEAGAGPRQWAHFAVAGAGSHDRLQQLPRPGGMLLKGGAAMVHVQTAHTRGRSAGAPETCCTPSRTRSPCLAACCTQGVQTAERRRI
jgi:hypothetical protein